MIAHNGVEYPSIRALALAHKRSPQTVQQRLKRGMSVAEALERPMSLRERGLKSKPTAFRRVY